MNLQTKKIKFRIPKQDTVIEAYGFSRLGSLEVESLEKLQEDVKRMSEAVIDNMDAADALDGLKRSMAGVYLSLFQLGDIYDIHPCDLEPLIMDEHMKYLKKIVFEDVR